MSDISSLVQLRVIYFYIQVVMLFIRDFVLLLVLKRGFKKECFYCGMLSDILDCYDIVTSLRHTYYPHFDPIILCCVTP